MCNKSKSPGVLYPSSHLFSPLLLFYSQEFIPSFIPFRNRLDIIRVHEKKKKRKVFVVFPRIRFEIHSSIPQFTGTFSPLIWLCFTWCRQSGGTEKRKISGQLVWLTHRIFRLLHSAPPPPHLLFFFFYSFSCVVTSFLQSALQQHQMFLSLHACPSCPFCLSTLFFQTSYSSLFLSSSDPSFGSFF